jgi:hypothetical protein
MRKYYKSGGAIFPGNSKKNGNFPVFGEWVVSEMEG